MIGLSVVSGAALCGSFATDMTDAQRGVGRADGLPEPQAAKMGQGPCLQPALGARPCGRHPAKPESRKGGLETGKAASTISEALNGKPSMALHCRVC